MGASSWRLLGKWLEGTGIQETGWSPAHALLPDKVTRSIQVTAPQGHMCTERAQFIVQLNTMVGLL